MPWLTILQYWQFTFIITWTQNRFSKCLHSVIQFGVKSRYKKFCFDFQWGFSKSDGIWISTSYLRTKYIRKYTSPEFGCMGGGGGRGRMQVWQIKLEPLEHNTHINTHIHPYTCTCMYANTEVINSWEHVLRCPKLKQCLGILASP